MNKSPLSQVSFESFDTQAPGAPALGQPVQIDDHTIKLTVTPPVVDADGGELTGLSKIRVGIALANEDGSTPFSDVDSFDATAVQVKEFDVDEESGPIEVELDVLASSRLHWIAAYAEDDASDETSDDTPDEN
jgi:hypothetical protein